MWDFRNWIIKGTATSSRSLRSSALGEASRHGASIPMDLCGENCCRLPGVRNWGLSCSRVRGSPWRKIPQPQSRLWMTAALTPISPATLWDYTGSYSLVTPRLLTLRIWGRWQMLPCILKAHTSWYFGSINSTSSNFLEKERFLEFPMILVFLKT